MTRLLIATTNKGKIAEFTCFLSDLKVKLLSINDLNIDEFPDETGKTYQENSRIKALFYAKKSGIPAVSDDGGIEISALGGAPGLKSSRWLGPKSTDEDIIQHMITLARKLPEKNRTAYFKTVVCMATPDGKVWCTRGQIKGIIANKPFLKISKGYPYRSFFYLPKLKKYYHEKDLSPVEQKMYNHRYKAVQKLKPIIRKILQIK